MDNQNSFRREMIIALHGMPGVGWHSIQMAVQSRLWERRVWPVELLLQAGLPKPAAGIVSGYMGDRPWRNAAADLPWSAVQLSQMRGSIHLIVQGDECYPVPLGQIAQPPWVLHAIGRLELLERPSAAIVGTRVPTSYGRHMASKFAQELSAEGLAVVSGLAKGVDSRAHEAALKGKGGTIAVLPTPIDRCYPAENEALYRRIGEQGLLLSETPLGMSLHKGQFHQRNRIIAGLSCATIVVEGAGKSGSAITAKHAFEMDRELFAVPGPVNSPKSEGPNELIRSGKARLISSTEQLFEELLWLRNELKSSGAKGSEPVAALSASAEQPTPEEGAIIALLRDGPKSIDELYAGSAIPFGHLNALLLNLSIKRKIELQPGSIYIAL